jgi:type IV secretion system protein VirB6
MSCPPLPFGEDANLADTLNALDCQVNGAVAAGYSRLFGGDGAFTVVLGAALTIYLAVIGLCLLTGRTRLTLSALGPRVVAVGFILTFATAWPAYQTVVYGLLTGGPDQIASAFMYARSGATQAFAARLDVLFDAMLEAGRALAAQPKSPNLDVALNLVWASAIILLLSTLGLLVIARLVLAVLLALGPVFIVLALFDATRGLFEGWLRTTVAFAFAPMLIVLGGSGLMTAVAPSIAAVAGEPVRAVTALRPVVSLFLISTIYAGLLAILAASAFALTRGWRVSRREPPPPVPEPSQVGWLPAEPSAQVIAFPRAAPGRDERTPLIAASVLREAELRRETFHTERCDVAGAPAARALADRRKGLGQAFRPSAERPSITRNPGS